MKGKKPRQFCRGFYFRRVMRGLDPRIDQKGASDQAMDCRVKPGNDDRLASVLANITAAPGP
jgi:hypothetical protein